jgi:hypothetical protein
LRENAKKLRPQKGLVLSEMFLISEVTLLGKQPGERK